MRVAMVAQPPAAFVCAPLAASLFVPRPARLLSSRARARARAPCTAKSRSRPRTAPAPPSPRAHAEADADADANADGDEGAARARAASPPPPLAPPPPPPPPPSLTRQLLSLAVPALGALALDPLLSLIDTAFVGRLGLAELAGVSLASLVLNVSFSLFNFLCISATPLVARALASADDDDNDSAQEAASRVTATALQLALLLGVLAAAGLAVSAEPLLARFGAAPAAARHAHVYLLARAPALPPALMSFVMNGALRAHGDLRSAFVVALVANLANILLDATLIFHLRLGVLGAALATSIAQTLACALMLANLLRRGLLRAGHVVRAPRGADVRALLSAGVLLAVRTASLLATVSLATASAARLGVASLAAHEVVRQLWVFHATLLDSLATAAQSLVAAAVAARARRRARAVATRAVQLSAAAASLIAAAAVLSGRALPGLFTSSAPAAAKAARCIRVAALVAPLNGAVFALDAVLAACADFRYLATAILAAGAVACAAILAVRLVGGDVAMIWAALNLLMVARGAVLFWRFYDSRGPMAAPPDNLSPPDALAPTPALGNKRS